jgi:hypothetical protein
MQKVVGSSPIIRSKEPAGNGRFFLPASVMVESAKGRKSASSQLSWLEPSRTCLGEPSCAPCGPGRCLRRGRREAGEALEVPEFDPAAGPRVSPSPTSCLFDDCGRRGG